MMRFENSFDNK